MGEGVYGSDVFWVDPWFQQSQDFSPEEPPNTEKKMRPQAVLTGGDDTLPPKIAGTLPKFPRFGTSSMQVLNGIGTPCLAVITCKAIPLRSMLGLGRVIPHSTG